MKLDHDTVVLYETASAWFTRRQAREGWSERVEADLQAWLQADPRHQQAYQEIADTWSAFDRVPRPALARGVRPGVALGRGRRVFSTLGQAGKQGGGEAGVFGRRRGFVAAALSACLLMGVGGWYWHDNTPQFAKHIQTAADERREVALPDGTLLTVNRDSRLEVLFYPRRREVLLERGEVYFNAAARGGDAFLVKAGTTRVRVVGTAFNVRTGPPTLYVKVQEGVVEVSSQGDARAYIDTLKAGEAVAVDSITGVQQRIASAPDVAGSWRTGRLVFRNAALSEVADELQGYLNQPIELTGSGVQQHRLSGVVSTADPKDFLESLPQLLPVEVERLPDGGYRIIGR